MVQISRELSNKFTNMSIIAAMAVVLIHCYLVGDKGTVFWWFTEIVGGGRWLTGGLVRFAVPFFFLSSGYFLAGRIDEQGWYKRAIISRIRSLVVPYFLWGAIAVAPFVAVGLFKSYTIPNFDFLMRGLGLQLHGLPLLKQLWYLRALFILVVLSPLLKYFANPIGLIIIWIGYAFQALEVFPVHWSWYSFFGNTVCMEGTFFMTVGMYLRKGDLRIDLLRLPCSVLIISALCMMICLVAYAFADYGCHVRIARLFKWLSIPFSLISIWGIVPAKSWHGNITSSSFPLYLMHYFFFMIIARVYDFSHCASSSLYMFICLVSSWIIAVGGSMILTLVLRKFLPVYSKIAFGGR